MNSRLWNRIREQEGISYSVFSLMEISAFEEMANLTIKAIAAPQNLSRAQQIIDEEWKAFIAQGVNEDELAKAQKSMRLEFENRLAKDEVLARQITADLATGRSFLWFENIYNRIDSLSVAEVNEVIKKWWADAAFSKVVAGDLAKANLIEEVKAE